VLRAIAIGPPVRGVALPDWSPPDPAPGRGRPTVHRFRIQLRPCSLASRRCTSLVSTA